MTKLKQARLLSEKRLIDVFNEIGIWPGRLSMIENNLLNPSEKELCLLAEIYKVSPDYLRPSNEGHNGF